MTRLMLECPTTGKPLPPITLADSDPDARVAVHCPKCSQLHVFSSRDAVEEDELALA